jgi:hypothetical protein
MCHGCGPSWPDDHNSTFTIGMRQTRKGLELLKGATEELAGAVDSGGQVVVGVGCGVLLGWAVCLTNDVVLEVLEV